MNEFEIIDFHTHPFIEKEYNFCFYDDTVNSTEDFVKDMNESGISKFCGSVIKRKDIEDFAEIRKMNDEAVKLRDMLGDKYIPGIHIHPKFLEESIKEMNRMKEKGVKLIGELVPYLMGWDSYYDESMTEIYKEAQKLGYVISIHTKYEESMENAVKNFPEITFVAAHPGDRKVLDEHIERMKKYENYYLDLSGTGMFRYGMVRKLVKSVGSERLLFGTDYPICNPHMYVQAVIFEKISDRDKENIFSGTAKKLLEIG
ncbi:MAG: amidohydrolase [Firmicutes bacterium]|nr:amidohydrolase [Bacillota bacterium]